MAQVDPITFEIGTRQVQLLAGDIAALPFPVDAIVSPDDNLLSHGGGASAAIWKAAGPELDEAASTRRTGSALALGDVFTTPAGRLKAEVILHAVTVDLVNSGTIAIDQLARLYFRAIGAAEDANARSIAFPLLGTGAAAVEPMASVERFVEAVHLWRRAPSTADALILCARDPDDIPIFAAQLAQDLAGATAFEDVVEELLLRIPGSSQTAFPALLLDVTELPPRARGPQLALLLEEALLLATVTLRDVRPDRNGELFHGDSILHSLGPDSGPTPTRLVTTLLTSAAAAGVPLSPTLTEDLQEALRARNQIVHSISDSHSFVLIAIAIVGILQWISMVSNGDEPQVQHEAEYSLSDEPESLARETVSRLEVRSRSLPQVSRPRSPAGSSAHTEATSPVPWASSFQLAARRADDSGTAPVRALHRLLKRHLTPKARRKLEARLEERGHRGPGEMRLLEYCASVDDVRQLLRDEFSTSDLEDIVASELKRVAQANEKPMDLATAVARHLGFSIPATSEGLSQALDQIKRMRRTLALGEAKDLASAVLAVSRRLEWACRVLLHFLAQGAWHTPAELLLRSWGVMAADESLRTASLGRLLHLVEKAGQRLLADSSPAVILFTQDIGRRELLPRDANLLAETRNAFAHYREGVTKDTAAEGRRFLDLAHRLLSSLREEPRIFPRLVLIEEVVIDRWGRRRVKGVDDEGNPERLFTDLALDPGQVYFMHPLTNPLRVDPILVPAGDLVWVEPAP